MGIEPRFPHIKPACATFRPRLRADYGPASSRRQPHFVGRRAPLFVRPAVYQHCGVRMPPLMGGYRSPRSMCFRPNSRESMDQAPGPIIARAAPRAAWSTAIHPSPVCVENCVNAIHSFTTAAKVPATGVHKPTRRNTPALPAMICGAAICLGISSWRLAIPK